MDEVVFRAGHLDFPASRGAIQTSCRESMPFQMTAGRRGSRAYASDLMRPLTFLATVQQPFSVSIQRYEICSKASDCKSQLNHPIQVRYYQKLMILGLTKGSSLRSSYFPV
jgi:hypothetical protein